MRASGASELRKFSHFYILKLLFLSIFCRYFRYFVGTSDMLVGLHVPTNFQMYRQNSEKPLLGGGGNCPPPPVPPSGYANGMHFYSLMVTSQCSHNHWKFSKYRMLEQRTKTNRKGKENKGHGWHNFRNTEQVQAYTHWLSIIDKHKHISLSNLSIYMVNMN